MVKILRQIVNDHLNLKAHFDFDKCIMRKLLNVFKFKMLRHGFQFRAMYVESSVSAIPASKAYKHLTLCGRSK